MDNSNVFKFINLDDLLKHLRDIDYQFSAPEYAYLIWQNRHLSVFQKHQEFQLLIESTDSCPVKTANCRNGWDLHQTISNYVAMEKKLINIFLKPEINSFYIAEWCELGVGTEETAFLPIRALPLNMP